jgi:hypothetical protein
MLDEQTDLLKSGADCGRLPSGYSQLGVSQATGTALTPAYDTAITRIIRETGYLEWFLRSCVLSGRVSSIRVVIWFPPLLAEDHAWKSAMMESSPRPSGEFNSWKLARCRDSRPQCGISRWNLSRGSGQFGEIRLLFPSAARWLDSCDPGLEPA